MQRSIWRRGALVLLIALLLLAAQLASIRQAGARPAPPPSAGDLSHPVYGNLPLVFEPNVGQAAPAVRYLARGPGFTLFLTQRGAVLSLTSYPRAQGFGASLDQRLHPSVHPARSAVVRLFPVGGSPHPSMRAEDKAAGIVNYLIGNDPKKWHTKIPTYRRIVYRGVYPGIDQAFCGRSGRLEYDWLVHPHANPNAIRMTVHGATSLHLDHQGDLLVRTTVGTIAQQVPHVFQARGGRDRSVPAGYRLLSGSRVGFHLANYDASAPLVIDPVLAYGTYLGGESAGYTPEGGVAVDSADDAFVTGTTSDTTFPTKNAYQQSNGAFDDAFVTEVGPTGSDLIYSTYLGGNRGDDGKGIAVDSARNAYITGFTNSTNFPGVPASPAGGYAPFVVKLNAGGSTLGYSHLDPRTQFGSSGAGIAVDASGEAFYAGYYYFPTATSSFDDTFVNKLNASGGMVAGYTTSESATKDTLATSLALGRDGYIWVAGSTVAQDFPVHHALQLTSSGGADAFVLRLDTSMTPVFATYLGGTKNDYAYGVGTDGAGNVYIAGGTASDNLTPAAPVIGSLTGTNDAFLTKLVPNGTNTYRYGYTRYLGGSGTGQENASGLAVDTAGNAYVTGVTGSADFPLVAPLAEKPAVTAQTGFVTEVVPDGQSLVYSTYLGSTSTLPSGIALDSTGSAYVTGGSTNFPVSANAFQRGLEGSFSHFVAKLSPPPPPTATPTNTALPTATNTPLLTATGTSVPAATTIPTGVPTAVPTTSVVASPSPVPATATPIPTQAPTSAPPPAPKKPKVTLASSSIRSGGSLKLTIVTSPRAHVTVTLEVRKHRKGKKATMLVYRTRKTGTAGRKGRFSASITITYSPSAPTSATLTIRAQTAGGTKSASKTVTILPRGRRG